MKKTQIKRGYVFYQNKKIILLISNYVEKEMSDAYVTHKGSASIFPDLSARNLQ